MAEDTDDWRPGSFTKNFAWGKETGLNKLYDCIRKGFNNTLEDVPRTVFRDRVEESFNFYIAANFFLFTKQIGTNEYLIVDELVFQAITSPYSRKFDMLALFAFNFTYAGKFRGASKDQRRPALWAHWYIRDRVAKQMDWSTSKVDADDIASFIFSDPRYKTSPSRKVATNLNHLYRIGRLQYFATSEVERWWVDAFFLALDRIIEDCLIDEVEIKEDRFNDMLNRSGFQQLTGKNSIEKSLAARHLLRLYTLCGNRTRFFEETVKGRTESLLRAAEKWHSPNDLDPVGAVHLSNVKIVKTIPAFCATLAAFAGFEIVSALSLENFDAESFVREHTRQAFGRLSEGGIRPVLTAEAVLQATREK